MRCSHGALALADILHVHARLTRGAADVGALADDTTLDKIGGKLASDQLPSDGVFTGSVQVGDTSDACASGNSGAVKFADGELQVCDGSDWLTLKASIPRDGSSQEDAAETCAHVLRVEQARG